MYQLPKGGLKIQRIISNFVVPLSFEFPIFKRKKINTKSIAFGKNRGWREE